MDHSLNNGRGLVCITLDDLCGVHWSYNDVALDFSNKYDDQHAEYLEVAGIWMGDIIPALAIPIMLKRERKREREMFIGILGGTGWPTKNQRLKAGERCTSG